MEKTLIQKPTKVSTDEIKAAYDRVQSKDFSNLSVSDTYQIFAQAAVYNGNFDSFVANMESYLAGSGWKVSGTRYAFCDGADMWQVVRGDISGLYAAIVYTTSGSYFCSSVIS
jgi:hypothetical protein